MPLLRVCIKVICAKTEYLEIFKIILCFLLFAKHNGKNTQNKQTNELSVRKTKCEKISAN